MICYVILHYMSAEETLACVESILNNVIGEKRIVVVDNASPNCSYDVLKRQFADNKNVDILKLEMNLGFAKGNNYGYKFAIDKYNPEFIIVMNNDMEIRDKNFQRGVLEAYKNYQYSILGPDIYSTKKLYHQNPQTRKLPDKKELKKAYLKLSIKYRLQFLVKLKWRIKGQMLSSKTQECVNEKKPHIKHVVKGQMLHGSCYVFSPLFIRTHKTECFYNKTFMYMEAEILYYLAIKNKEKIIYYPFIRVEHHEDVSTNALYKKQYEKSLFSIKCLKQSTKAFIELIEEEEQVWQGIQRP